MKNLKPKLITLENIKNSSASVYKKNSNACSLRKYGKAIVFKDCKPNATTYLNILKMLSNTESFKISYFNINESNHQNQTKSSEDSRFDWHTSKENKTIYAKKTNQSNLNVKMNLRDKTPNMRKINMLKNVNHETKTGNRCFSLNLKCLRLDLHYVNEARQI